MTRSSWSAAIVACSAIAGPALAEARPLAAASDGVHAWVVVERTRAAGTEHVLLHHAAPMGCDCVHEAFVFPRAPEAMAADGARVWIVMPAERGGRRDVFSLSTQRNPATGAYYSLPAGRLEIHPSLPGEGELLATEVTDDCLSVRRSGAPAEELGPTGWTAAQRAPSAGQGAAFDSAIPGAARRSRLVRLGAGARAIEYDGPSGPIRLAEFEAPARAFAVLGVGDRFGIFVPTGEGGAAVRWVDPVDGTVSPQRVLEPQPADATAWVCLPVLGVMAAGAAAGLLARRFLRLKSPAPERR